MIRFFTALIAGMALVALVAFAEDDVDAAAKKLQSDVTKLNADIAADVDKNVLVADKKKIKADKDALKTARQSAKSELIKGHTANGYKPDQGF